jgi:hypothetical protein
MGYDSSITSEIAVITRVSRVRALSAVCAPQIAHLEDKLGVELAGRLEVGEDVLEAGLGAGALSDGQRQRNRLPCSRRRSSQCCQQTGRRRR